MSVAGTLVESARDFRDGGEISEGEQLFEINPSRLETATALAESDMADPKPRLTWRRGIALEEVRRNLAETVVNAPFNGVMSDVSAVSSRRVSTNEKLGVLVDLSALEIAFRVSNNQFARMLEEDGTLRRSKVS